MCDVAPVGRNTGTGRTHGKVANLDGCLLAQ
jgi:hypothetical protein